MHNYLFIVFQYSYQIQRLKDNKHLFTALKQKEAFLANDTFLR